MGVVSRFLVFLLALSAALLSMLVLGVCAGLLSEDFWINTALYAAGRTETAVVALATFFISLFLLSRFFSRKRDAMECSGELLLDAGPIGGVRVSVEAVKEFVEVTACEMHGIIDARARIGRNRSDSSLAGLSLRLIVSRKADIPALSASLTEAIQSRVQHSLGLGSVPVEISVAGISDAAPKRKQRVV